SDGQMALARLADLRPDVILLDLEMPVLDGLQTLVALRKTHPRLPVIMFSRFTQRGVEATVQALTLGADDYVAKPGDGLDATTCLEQILTPKTKLLGGRIRPAPPASRAAATPAHRPVPTQQARIEAVVIGASTGGPNALAELLPAFPPDWSVPLFIVQHMPANFTARLAERLAEKSGLWVREAVSGELAGAAQAWVAPGDHHLLVRRDAGLVRVELNREAPVNSC